VLRSRPLFAPLSQPRLYCPDLTVCERLSLERSHLKPCAADGSRLLTASAQGGRHDARVEGRGEDCESIAAASASAPRRRGRDARRRDRSGLRCSLSRCSLSMRYAAAGSPLSPPSAAVAATSRPRLLLADTTTASRDACAIRMLRFARACCIAGAATPRAAARLKHQR
jgi:hypothetical protein